MQKKVEDSSTDPQLPKEIFRIIHFNDVYDLQPGDKEPKGGVASFLTAINHYKTQNTLTLFSGDVFAPSVLSDIYNGEHMIQPLNAFGIDVACFGNHDFDFEIQTVMELKNMTNFPWLLSNVYDRTTGDRLGEAEQYSIFYRGSKKIGIFGLAEKEWLDTLLVSYLPRCEYMDFVDCAVQMVRVLREQHKCDIVIALTHMMGYNDSKLVNKVDGIDFVLGGHDHLIRHEQHQNTVIVKSGTNFRTFSVLKILEGPASPSDKFTIQKGKYIVDFTLEQVTSKFKPDPKLQAYVRKMYAQFETRQNSIIGFSDTDVDLRFGFIRISECPFMNMVADWYKYVTNADCVLLNSGNFRFDGIIKSGPVSYGAITNQILDKIVSKKVTGSQLLAVLENAVGMYPNMSGRFGSYSSIQFSWDPKLQPFHRVIPSSVFVNSEPLNIDRTYLLGCHQFHASGGDGFACLKDCEYVIKPEEEIINQRLILDMMVPMSARSVGYRDLVSKTWNQHSYRIMEYEGKQIIAFKVSEVPRTVML